MQNFFDQGDRLPQPAGELSRQERLRRAEAVFKVLQRQIEYSREQMPGILDRLEAFRNTRRTRLLYESQPHPFVSTVLAGVYAATGASPEMMDADGFKAGVPVPPEVQQQLQLSENIVKAHVSQSPMLDGGYLLKLEYGLPERGIDAVVLLAAANALIPEQG